MIHNNDQSNGNGRLQGELRASTEMYFEMSTGVASIGDVLPSPEIPKDIWGPAAAGGSVPQLPLRARRKEKNIWLLQVYGISREI